MTECILWTGYINPGGYGLRGHVLVHREALAKKLGRPVEPGMDACHTCDNRACINPDHLYEGTRKQNMADCTARGRHNKPHGESHWSCKLSDADVKEIREMAESGWLKKDIADKFGIDASYAGRIVRGVMRKEATT